MQSLTKDQLKGMDAIAALIGLDETRLIERVGIEFSQTLMQSIKKEQSILFICGSGNNGEDGLSCARHLTNKGYTVSVLLTKAKTKRSTNAKILDHMNIPIHIWSKDFSLTPYDVIIDCMLGIGQIKTAQKTIKEIVQKVKEDKKRVIACDIPTGINATTGEVFDTSLAAELTVSFAAPKKAFDNQKVKQICGKILIVGIGIPKQVYEQLGLKENEYIIEGVKTYD